jgi:hypothetical protein
MELSIINGRFFSGEIGTPETYQEYGDFTIAADPGGSRTMRPLTRSPPGGKSRRRGKGNPRALHRRTVRIGDTRQPEAAP